MRGTPMNLIRHWRALRILALLAALALAAPAWAGRPLVLAFDELRPWKTLHNGQYGGAYTEIVRELARRVALPLEIVNCPLKRCLYMLEQGAADIVIGYQSTPAREQFLHFLATPYRTRSADKVFYVRRGGKVRIDDYADLAGLRIGVKLGSAGYFPRFDADAALNKVAARDMEVNLRKLALDRLDAVLIPEDQGEALVAQMKLGRQLHKAPYRQADPSSRAVALAKRSPHAQRLPDFEQAMASMVRDGTLARIYRRHYYQAMHVAQSAVQIR
jgi:polar amino acid transport system substrate-binding protein